MNSLGGMVVPNAVGGGEGDPLGFVSGVAHQANTTGLPPIIGELYKKMVGTRDNETPKSVVSQVIAILVAIIVVMFWCSVVMSFIDKTWRWKLFGLENNEHFKKIPFFGSGDYASTDAFTAWQGASADGVHSHMGVGVSSGASTSAGKRNADTHRQKVSQDQTFLSSAQGPYTQEVNNFVLQKENRMGAAVRAYAKLRSRNKRKSTSSVPTWESFWSDWQSSNNYSYGANASMQDARSTGAQVAGVGGTAWEGTLQQQHAEANPESYVNSSARDPLSIQPMTNVGKHRMSVY